jgi:hypothetical protein
MDAEGIPEAIRRHDTAPVFDWLVAAFSYQGISDRVAAEYMTRHGRIRWHAIDAEVRANPSCPKLKNYWEFYDCRFDKISRTCAEPEHIEACPLPRHQLRNGRLNQTAYALYFFIRDIAAGDLVGWIDSQLARPDAGTDANRLARIALRIIDPLRYVYGVSEGPDYDPVVYPFGRASRVRALAPGRRQHDCGRYAGAQVPAPDWYPGPVWRRPLLRRRLLSGLWVHRNSRSCCPANRRHCVQSGLPCCLPQVRSTRCVAVLRAERSGRLQRQSDRRSLPLRQRLVSS